MAKKRIREPPANKGARFRAAKTVDHDYECILFSLERLQGGSYCLSSLDRDDKACFADAIFKRKNFCWKELKGQNRHALGFEKIATDAIQAPIPSFITEDNRNLLAFRFSGKKPMVGYRLRNIFYILWFDAKFELYKH